MSDTPRDDRAELAALALGRLDDVDRVGLESRLDADADLRRELAELRALVDLLSMVDPTRLEGREAPPAHLEHRVVDAVAREQRNARRRRRGRWAIATGAAAAAFVIVLVLAFAIRTDDEPSVSAFDTTAEGAEGGYAVEAQPWGTEIVLDVAGLERGEVYWLWLSDADGNRSGAGTFRGDASDQRLTMASALPVAEAARIWVTDEDDEVVLDSFLR